MKSAMILAAAAAASAEVIPGEYLVQFKNNLKNLDATQEVVSRVVGAENIMRNVNIGEFHMVAVKGDEHTARLLESMEEVEIVEQNAMAYATECTVQTAGSWGVTRVNTPGNTNNYIFDTTVPEAGIRSYVLDTGIRYSHSCFGGRASFGADFTGEGDNDQNGHGTHVAGTVVGNPYGIARTGSVIDVKVLGRGGGGSWAGVAGGIDWAAADCRNQNAACVANLSLGGGFSAIVDNAVNAAAEAGVIMVCAGGNTGGNNCGGSPGGATGAYTVGSTDASDNRSSFSSFGACTDIFAPGGSITSASHLSDTGAATMSGTSMAAPHVAGAAQLMLQRNPALSAAEVQASLRAEATASVGNPGAGTTNLLLNKPCRDAGL